MPLTKIQADVLRVLASRRDPESYVGGGTPLNQEGGRYSEDIDIFHDRAESLERTAGEDTRILEEAGYEIQWIRQSDLMRSADVVREDSTRLEWVVDSDYRFFPTIPDATFGYMLHPVDLAANKIMAAAGRRELRDLIDLLTIHDLILPLGAVACAAVDKSPGYTPEGLFAEIRRNSNYPAPDWKALSTVQPVDPKVVMPRLRAILEEAEAFVLQVPTAKLGLLFLENGKVVQPDPSRLDQYETHAGRRRGHWPESYEIGRAMLDRVIGRDQ
ncbi:MAG: hypothetical protein HY820_43035 [Acidobacteria bacterium]|nr:hypothetical protein [Acidobacteriota bacterium]